MYMCAVPCAVCLVYWLCCTVCTVQHQLHCDSVEGLQEGEEAETIESYHPLGQGKHITTHSALRI